MLDETRVRFAEIGDLAVGCSESVENIGEAFAVFGESSARVGEWFAGVGESSAGVGEWFAEVGDLSDRTGDSFVGPYSSFDCLYGSSGRVCGSFVSACGLSNGRGDKLFNSSPLVI